MSEPVYEFVKGKGWIVTASNMVYMPGMSEPIDVDRVVDLAGYNPDKIRKYMEVLAPQNKEAIRNMLPNLCADTNCDICSTAFNQNWDRLWLMCGSDSPVEVVAKQIVKLLNTH